MRLLCSLRDNILAYSDEQQYICTFKKKLSLKRNRRNFTILRNDIFVILFLFLLDYVSWQWNLEYMSWYADGSEKLSSYEDGTES